MKSLILALVGLGGLAACASGPALAQESRYPNVMVIAEDSDIDSVPLSNDIHTRITDELRAKMLPTFRVLDTDAVLAALKWPPLRDRLPRADKIRLAKEACTNGKAAVCPRFLVLVKARPGVEDLSFGSIARIRLQGDIVDIQNNTVLGNWQPISKEFTAPARCNNACVDEVIGEHAYDIASDLGEVLKIKLEPHIVAGPVRNTGRAASPTTWTDYVVTFRGFSRSDIIGMLDVMETVWDGGKAVVGDCNACSSAAWHQNYRTRMNTTQLQTGFTRLLLDMGLSERKFRITTANRTDGQEIVIEKILP